MTDRVMFISDHASPMALLGGVDAGGQNVYIDRVARELAKAGVYVDVYTRWDDKALPRVVDYAPGVRIIHVKAGERKPLPKEELFPHMDEFFADMLAFIRENQLQYDLAHAHFWMSGYVALSLKEALGIPFVITFHALGKVRRHHQGAADAFPDARFTVEEMIVREADALIAECPQDREDLLIHYFARDEKIKIVPCGFDSREFFPLDKVECARRIGTDPAEKTILQLGRMVPRKGVDNVVRAIARLVHQYKLPVRLLIVGGESALPDPNVTPEIGRLQDLANELDVTQNVTFVGSRDRSELKYYYNASDVFVSTPWYEPFGITILEAMACGLPVVGSNVGGIKHSIDHDRTGFLVPPNEPAILAARLHEILQSPALQKAFSERALNRVRTRFTWQIVTEQLMALYEDVEQGRMPAPQIIDSERARPLPSLFDAGTVARPYASDT